MTTSTAPDMTPVALLTKPSVSYVHVTPDQAARWLTGNIVNRNLREKKVNQFASDMEQGHWTLSNDAICFAPDGRLLNGQHRLTAIVRSESTILMLVARNMPPETMATMDSGSARTAADALTFSGEVNTHALAAVGRLAILYADGRLYRDTKVQAVSHAAILEFINEDALIRHSAFVGRHARAKVDAPPSVLGVAHWIIAGAEGVALADHYINQLSTRTGEPEGSAVLAVDSRLRQLRRQGAKPSARSLLHLLIKGWNAYAVDRRVASLALNAEAHVPPPARWAR